MAIAVDNTTIDAWTSSRSSGSFSHTCTSASALLVFVTLEEGTDADRAVSALTYDSSSLSTAKIQDNVANNLYAGVFYIANPSEGANTVAYTFVGDNVRGSVIAISFTGTDTSTVIGNTAGESVENDDAPSIDLTTGTDNSWVIDCMAYGGTGVTPDGSQTELFTEDYSVFSSGNASYETTTTAGTVTMNWTGGSSLDDVAHAVIELLDDGGAPAAISSKRLLSGHGR